MATWKAKCWLGSEVGYQNLEVDANTYQGADSQLRRIYGAEQVINLRKSGGGSSLSDIGEMGGWMILGMIIFVTWIIMEFWWIVIPVLAFGGLGWLVNWWQNRE